MLALKEEVIQIINKGKTEIDDAPRQLGKKRVKEYLDYIKMQILEKIDTAERQKEAIS